MGIPIDYVAGTSMGSIIGGLYALGYTPDQLAQLISNMNWSEYIGNKIDRSSMSKEMRQRNSSLVLSIPFSLESLFDNDSKTTLISQLPSAYVNNSSLINLFNDLCVGYQEEMDFNDLPIPFACVATDMITGNEVVLRNGSVPTAMRASMAIPGVFSPVQIDDKVLVDGGLVNNFPADVLRDMGADIIIGIEITSNKDVTAEDLQSLPQVFGRLVTNSTSSKREENRELCKSNGNIYMVPDITGYGMLSFTPEAIDTLVQRGYKKASEFHDALQRVKRAVDYSAGFPVGKTLHAPQAKNIAIDTVMVRSVSINNVSEAQSRWLVRKGNLGVEKKYTQNDIEYAMQVYRGTGCFDDITYQVKESDSLHRSRILEGLYDLKVNVRPAKPHTLGLGVRYDTEEGAGLLLHLGLNEKKFGGPKFNANFKLSYCPKINLTFTYSVPSVANFNVAYDYRNEHFRALVENKKSINLHYRQNKASFYISQFHLLSLNTNAGLSFANTSYDQASIESDEADSTWFRNNRLLTPFVNLEFDNLDDAYFAKHGYLARLTGRYHVDLTQTDSAHNWVKGNCWEIGYAFQAYITPRDWKITIIPQIYGRWVFNNPIYHNLWNTYGGEIEGRHFESQMPFIGFNTVESASDKITIFRTDLRFNVKGNHYITATYNFLLDWIMIDIIHSGIEGTFIDAHGVGLKYSYNSPLGPVSLTLHWSRRYSYNLPGAYFSFGYTF
jgi:NTE family protein